MTAFSLRLTNGANAVSQLHAETANATWSGVLDRPILGITNGVHVPTWVGTAMSSTLLGATSRPTSTTSTRRPSGAGSGSGWRASPTAELWEAHQRQKLELAIFARGRLRNQFARHGEAPAVLEELETRARPGHPDDRLRPPVRDLQAGRRCCSATWTGWPGCCGTRIGRSRSSSPARPTRPTGPGQRVIQDIFTRSRSPEAPRPGVHPRGLRHADRPLPGPGRRRLAQQPAPAARGVRDVRDEGGRRTASSTCRVLDGWWDEGWTGDNGWAIGGRETNPDEGAQDWADAQDLYRILEDEVVPRYYQRDKTGVPRGWIDAHARRRSRARSGASRRPGCSTSTSSSSYLPAAGGADRGGDARRRPARAEAG